MESAGIDIIGVNGGFLNQIIKGNTLLRNESLDDTLMALEGVRKGAPNTFLYTPLPYSDRFLNIDETIRLASKLIKGGADAIHIGGWGKKIKKIKALTEEGIPCCGHLGLVPKYSTWLGGLKSQGKKAIEAVKIYKDILEVQEAGGIWVELECVPYMIAAEITKRAKIPIIGIGSGPYCDGEIQIHLDTLGLHDGHYPKHSKIYINFFKESMKAFNKYKEEVVNGDFPTKEYGFETEDDEFEKFINEIDKL